MESGSPEDAQAGSEEDYVQGENGMLSLNSLFDCYIYFYYCKKRILHKQHMCLFSPIVLVEHVYCDEKDAKS